MSLVDETISVEGVTEVTASDSVDLPLGVCRGIWVGVAGDVKVTTPNGHAVTYPAVVAGISHPIKARRIWSTGTTATTILALY